MYMTSLFLLCKISIYFWWFVIWRRRSTAKVICAMRDGYVRKGGEKPGVGISLLLTKGAKGTKA